jgi:hypothetical protein
VRQGPRRGVREVGATVRVGGDVVVVATTPVLRAGGGGGGGVRAGAG